jgi:hypothetical protein
MTDSGFRRDVPALLGLRLEPFAAADGAVPGEEVGCPVPSTGVVAGCGDVRDHLGEQRAAAAGR